MKAMVLEKILPVKDRSLKLVDLPVPTPGSKQILVKVSACGVCHSKLTLSNEKFEGGI